MLLQWCTEQTFTMRSDGNAMLTPHQASAELSWRDCMMVRPAGRPLPPLVNWGAHELDSLSPDAQQILRGPQAFAAGSSAQ